ncbi:MAG: hypothetical protein II924_04145 [Kiritimatiellae bacterium]|nr:hypothetical protein [Kiritimatiellia bacterium]
MKTLKKAAAALAVSSVFACAAAAAGFEAGRGVANDLATGANARDVTFVPRGGGNAYGWQSYDLAVGATFLSWAVPNGESSVYGLRLNFGWGEYLDTYGLDAGFFSATARDFGGIATSALGHSVGGTMGGIQIGAVNIAHVAYGLQLGFVNFADDLHGVQLGVLNFNNTGLRCFPVLNVGF